ncbi:sulfatase-like hydrolase/transferase [Vibrio breoganii]
MELFLGFLKIKGISILVISSLISYFLHRRTLISLIAAYVLLVLGPYLVNTYKIIEYIGVDSLFEISNPSFLESIFYLETILKSYSKFNDLYLLYLFLISISAYITYLIFKVKLLMNFLLVVSLVFVAYDLISLYKLGLMSVKEKEKIYNSFSNKIEIDELHYNYNSINITLYIGESTSINNMSLYGYFRNTTPYLDEMNDLGKIVKFNNVFSTHTHTTPSLLDALSFRLDRSLLYDANHNNKRSSFINVLNEFEINSYLFSNQGNKGSWNYASNVIFKNATETSYNRQGKSIGNLMAQGDDYYDRDYLKRVTPYLVNNSGVNIFHSYAGHGDYCNNLPQESRRKVDGKLKILATNSVDNKRNISNIECYDSAIRYIDGNLKSIIEELSVSKYPQALVYFSDHGESVYTGVGHDSSRFKFEMITVPLIIYLNDSAKNAYEISNLDRFKNQDYLTLDVIPYIIFDLKGIKLMEYSPLNEILFRKTISGNSSLNFSLDNNYDNLFNNFVRKKKNQELYSCLDGFNSIGMLVRYRLVFDCLKTKVDFNDGEFNIVDNKNDSYSLKSIIINKLFMYDFIWFEISNIKSLTECIEFSNNLSIMDRSFTVSFKGNENKVNFKNECMAIISKNNGYISFYDLERKLQLSSL